MSKVSITPQYYYSVSTLLHLYRLFFAQYCVYVIFRLFDGINQILVKFNYSPSICQQLVMLLFSVVETSS